MRRRPRNSGQRTSQAVLRRWAAVVLVAAALTVLAVTERTSSAPIVLSLTLDKVVVTAGEQIHGQVSITNTTSKAIPAPAATCIGLVWVGLTNSHVPFEPASWPGGCGADTLLEPGTTRVPVTIETTYFNCTQNASADGSPECTSAYGGTGMPPLPAGTYNTAIALDLPSPAPKIEMPAPIRVTIVG